MKNRLGTNKEENLIRLYEFIENYIYIYHLTLELI